MFEGKVCPYLAQGLMANEGDITTPATKRSPAGYDGRCKCIGEDCARYPVCVAEAKEAETK